MRRPFPLIVLIGLWAGDVLGQGMDLKACIDYALENSAPMQNARLDEKSALAKVRETAGLGLPQVSGSVSFIHNTQLRRFFTTYSENSFFFGGQSVPGLNEGDVVSAQNFFQLKSSGDAGVNISQLIFNGSYFVGLQAANALKELTVRSTDRQAAETIDQVSKSYYLLIINRERIRLFDQNLARIDTLLRTTAALFKQGFAESIDVDRLQVAANNLRTERDKFSSLTELSLELLRFQMNFPSDQPLEIAGDLKTLNPVVNLNEYQAGWSYNDRPEIRVLESNRRLQQLSIRNNYAQAVPYIAAIGNLGYSTQSPNVSGLFRTSTNLSDNGSFGPDSWYPYSFVGLSMNVPIFSGLQRTYRIQQEKITLVKLENSIRQVKSGIDLETRQAGISYQNAVSTIESQRRNVSLAENISRVARLKYEQGVGSNLEVMEAETSLRESQINYYNAMYDAIIAKLALDKAFGKLVPVQK